jgi:hypothetical protein
MLGNFRISEGLRRLPTLRVLQNATKATAQIAKCIPPVSTRREIPKMGMPVDF